MAAPSGPSPAGDDPAPAGLGRTTSVVGACTLLSRVSGLVREIVFAQFLGAGPLMDAFVVAFRIPNLLRRFFAEGAFAQALVPVIADYRARRPAELRELLERSTGTLALALLGVTAAGVLLAPLLTLAFAGGFVADDGRFDLTTAMLRITFPYVLFISLTALAGAILNAHGRFAVPAFTPVLLNLALIAAAAWLAPRSARPELALAGGVLVAGVVQLAFQVPFLWRLKLLPRPRFGFAHAGVRRVLSLMAPALLGSSAAQISILLNTLLASFLAAGSVSWLYYADRLVEFPLGVFGIALATAILPRLSEQHAAASPERFAATLDWALKLVLVMAVPATLGLTLLAGPVLATLFHGGAFTAQDTAMATAGLWAYAPGLTGFVLVKVLAPGYFARQDTRTPVRIAVQSLVLGLALNLGLLAALGATGFAPPHAAIAAATSAAAWFNAVLLFRGLRQRGVYRAGAGWPRLFAQVGGAAVAMTLALWAGLALAGDWLAPDRLERALRLAALVGGGAAIYAAAAWALGLRLRHLRLALH